MATKKKTTNPAATTAAEETNEVVNTPVQTVESAPSAPAEAPSAPAEASAPAAKKVSPIHLLRRELSDLAQEFSDLKAVNADLTTKLEAQENLISFLMTKSAETKSLAKKCNASIETLNESTSEAIKSVDGITLAIDTFNRSISQRINSLASKVGNVEHMFRDINNAVIEYKDYANPTVTITKAAPYTLNSENISDASDLANLKDTDTFNVYPADIIAGPEGSIGDDIRILADVSIPTGRTIIFTNKVINLPLNIEAKIEPRSGFSSRGIWGKVLDFVSHHIFCFLWSDAVETEVYNNFDADVLSGKVDPGYISSPIGIIIKNHGRPFTILAGTKIAQVTYYRTQRHSYKHLDLETPFTPHVKDRKGGIGHSDN